MLDILLHPTAYCLYLFLTLILITQVINPYYDFSRAMKNITLPFGLRFLKIADLTVFLLFFIKTLLPPCGDIEEILGLKYSILTNLDRLTLTTPLKYHYSIGKFPSSIMTLYA